MKIREAGRSSTANIIQARPLRRTAMSMAVATALSSSMTMSPAFAEQAIEEVVVTGFRKSLQDSIGIKRDHSSIVEVVSAEDIGKLPDSSIAEAIARLPGLAAQRLDGRASRVSIRGFGENESATTFNGREQVSISDNRGVEFDLYPSEIMSGVVVYKTPDASLEAEGIAGVIDLQSVKPLERNRVFQANVQQEQTSLDKLNPDGDDTGHRASFSYIDQFADNTIGLAIAYSTIESPNQEERWNAWGYPEFTYQGSDFSILGGAKPFVRSSLLDRESTMIVLQAQPNDRLNVTFDALLVDFTDQKILRGTEIPFAWGQGSISADTAVVDPDTGFVVAATTEGQRVVVRNDWEERDAKLKSYGINVEYDLGESWALEFDISRSEVERDVFSLESYSGTGRGDAMGVPDTLRYDLRSSGAGAVFTPGLDYSDPNLILLGGPLTWGWQQSLNEKYNIVGTPLENTAQDGFINSPTIDDELTALRLAATQQLENDHISSIQYGVSYRAREKTKDSRGHFMTLNSFPDLLARPDGYSEGTVSLDFIGMGNMIAYDSKSLVDDGFYELTEESGADHSTKSWTVEEDVLAFFIQANIDSELMGRPLTGNFGIRYVSTEQASQGTALQAGVLFPTSSDHDYSHVLPSLNLSLALTDNQSLRFGVAKTISRPRMDEMNASVELTVNQVPDANGNFIVARGGNPELEPREATGWDLTYENYFSDEGYFSLAYFYKDLEEWSFDGAAQVPATNYLANPPSANATAEFKTNGGGGDLSGWEATLSLPFNVISEKLDGFGFIASYTDIDSDIQDHNGNDFQLAGLSETIENATLYYEKYGVQIRASVRTRDDFKGDVYGLGFNTVQVDIEGETIVDAQIGYDFGASENKFLQGLFIYLQGINLTDEPFHSTQGSELKTRDYQSYGKTYLLGANYKL